jgi:hypothetical protein
MNKQGLAEIPNLLFWKARTELVCAISSLVFAELMILSEVSMLPK